MDDDRIRALAEALRIHANHGPEHDRVQALVADVLAAPPPPTRDDIADAAVSAPARGNTVGDDMSDVYASGPTPADPRAAGARPSQGPVVGLVLEHNMTRRVITSVVGDAIDMLDTDGCDKGHSSRWRTQDWPDIRPWRIVALPPPAVGMRVWYDSLCSGPVVGELVERTDAPASGVPYRLRNTSVHGWAMNAKCRCGHTVEVSDDRWLPANVVVLSDAPTTKKPSPAEPKGWLVRWTTAEGDSAYYHGRDGGDPHPEKLMPFRDKDDALAWARERPILIGKYSVVPFPAPTGSVSRTAWELRILFQAAYDQKKDRGGSETEAEASGNRAVHEDGIARAREALLSVRNRRTGRVRSAHEALDEAGAAIDSLLKRTT